MLCLCFNPRTHTGCDISASLLRCRCRFQSTHPYRVRQFRTPSDTSHTCFNPRTHTGCDVLPDNCKEIFLVSIHAPIQGATLSIVSRLSSRKMFQSTHPYRVRLNVNTVMAVPPCFNPRTHTGCDYSSVDGIVTFLKFQSTHPYRVRPLTR